MSSPSSRRWITICVSFAALALLVFAWFKWRSPYGAEEPFTMIKIWNEPTSSSPELSDGFLWIHRQCLENLADFDGVGQMLKRGADEISRLGARTWRFKIAANSKWSDDGSPVKAEQFVSAFKVRSGKIELPEFKRIKNITAKDDAVEVELDGEEDPSLDLAALTSPWLSPLRRASSWSWQTEVDGPCNGPFVPARHFNREFALVRNKHWRQYDAALISSVKVLLRDNVEKITDVAAQSTESPSKNVTPISMFGQGLLSYVGPSSVDLKDSVQRVVYGHAFLDPKAYYMILNPNGLLGGKYTALAHRALNRGELSGVVNGAQKFFTSHRVIPLSLLAKDANGQPVSFTPVNLESVQEARRILGIKPDAPITDVKPPFKKKLIVVNAADDAALPMAERFALRINANYKVDADVVSAADGKMPKDWDVVLVSVDIKDGIFGLSRNLSKAVSTYAPSRQDLAAKISALAKDKSETLISPKAVGLANQIDQLAPQSSVVLPLGQFGYAILVDDRIIDVGISGDVKRDPDVSVARRLKREPKS